MESQKTFVGGMSVQDEVADTGLMMMGHRFYAPDHGRFLNRDPIGFAGGMNLYSYAANSPNAVTDHAGLQPDLEDSDARRKIYSGAFSELFSLEMLKKWGKSQLEAIATLDIRGQIVDYVTREIGLQSYFSGWSISGSSDENKQWTMLLIAAAFKSKAALQKMKKEARAAGRACVPENDLFGAGLHGLKWGDSDAFLRAMRTGKPQGRFTKEALTFADDQAQTLLQGQADSFPLPPGVTAPVFMPDGKTIMEADHVFVWRNIDGQWHGYPRVGRGTVFGK